MRDLPGGVGYHEDDWESYQLRITPDGADARASSHNGYDYEGGPRNWLSDAGVVHPAQETRDRVRPLRAAVARRVEAQNRGRAAVRRD